MNEIKDLTGKKFYEIAEILRIEPETLTRGASPQTLGGLEVLLELEQTKKKLEAFEHARDILTGKTSVEPVKYPETKPEHYGLNDPDAEWRQEFESKANKAVPVTALRLKDGAALIFANWGTDTALAREELMGTKWLKFLEPGERTRLLAWLNDPDKPSITYRGRIPHTDRVVQVTLKKKVFGPVAVCTGLAVES